MAEPATLAEIVEQHYAAVLRLSLGLSGNAHDAEDIAQEVFVAVMKALPSFRGDAQIGTWIYRIAFRVAGRWLARRRRSDELPDTLTASDASIPIDLIRALNALPFDARMVVLLIGVEGQTYEEAAQILNIPEGTVASRFHYARERLARLLDAR